MLVKSKKKTAADEEKAPVFVWKDGKWFDETKRQEYPVPEYPFDFTCRDLWIGHGADAPIGDDTKLPGLTAHVEGIAELDGGRLTGSSVHEMSDPEPGARRFKLIIRKARSMS